VSDFEVLLQHTSSSTHFFFNTLVLQHSFRMLDEI
jgi:hypothetical protein